MFTNESWACRIPGKIVKRIDGYCERSAARLDDFAGEPLTRAAFIRKAVLKELERLEAAEQAPSIEHRRVRK